MSLLQQVQDGPKAPKPKKNDGLRPEDLLNVVLQKLKPEQEPEPIVEEPVAPPPVVKPTPVPTVEQVVVPAPPAPGPVINTAVPVSGTPLEDLLKGMLLNNMNKHPTKWVFTIKRNAAGFIESIEANAN